MLDRVGEDAKFYVSQTWAIRIFLKQNMLLFFAEGMSISKLDINEGE